MLLATLLSLSQWGMQQVNLTWLIVCAVQEARSRSAGAHAAMDHSLQHCAGKAAFWLTQSQNPALNWNAQA